MATYWLTFRIEDVRVDGRSYGDRYNDLNETVRQSCTAWWTESTSFIVFESNQSIETLMARFKATISSAHDLLLMRVMENKSALIAGNIHDPDIFTLIPYLKKA